MTRIAVTGPESTGKTVLAEQLSSHLNGVLIAEYARDYLDQLRRPYTPIDVVNIGKEQFRRIIEASEMETPAMVADTELLVISIWLQFKYGLTDPDIEEMLQAQPFDIYLLCDTDLPWEEDPLRENPNEREALFALYQNRLNALRVPYRIVSGTGETRKNNALRMIDLL
jgi:nicotinamide riboside kinase